jgi:hypothetical protein
MTDPTADDGHHFEVDHSDCGYRARCSCGWVSPWADTMTEANLAGFHHELVKRPGEKGTT